MGKVTAIILAAGKGNRMHTDVPKQFLDLCGKPVLYYSLKAFQDSSIDDIVLVTGKEDIIYCEDAIVEKYHLNKVKAVVAGGPERCWSVKNGLVAAEGAEYVLIHDAARPCVTVEMIEDSVEAVRQFKACTVGVPVKDTIKVVDYENVGIDTPVRDTLWQIQTPQSFCYDNIMKAYSKMERSQDVNITDDTMIMERYLGQKTKVISGDYRNIKITTSEDLLVAKIFLGNLEKSC